MEHRDVEVSDGGPTAVVGPDRELCGGHTLCWNAPYRSVACLKGQTVRQTGCDGPRSDLSRTGQRGVQRQITAGGVLVEREVVR